jgi:hypothetical protein
MFDRMLQLSAIIMLTGPCCRSAFSEVPGPSLDSVYPMGGTAGTSVLLEIAGKNLLGLKRLHSSIPGCSCLLKDAAHCELSIPADVMPGVYDLWAIADAGVSSPRSFSVGHRPEILEMGENDSTAAALAVSLNSVVNGRIDPPGDQDCFQFQARAGQRVILDCQAERIDSRLRAVLEVFDAQGQRLAVDRGYHGVDPQIDFRVPVDGDYVVKIRDLIYSGGAEHTYRLKLDAGPQVAFTVPNVIARGQAARVQVFGWNLPDEGSSPVADVRIVSPQPKAALTALDRIEVDLPATAAQDVWPLPIQLASHQSAARGFAYHHPGSDSSVLIGVADGPVTLERGDHPAPSAAQAIPVPCDVSGRLVKSGEQDWYALDVRRGEVLYFDLWSQRFGAPTDLQLSLWNTSGTELQAEWNDEPKNLGGDSFPTGHLDPSGRWVAPANGRFLLMVRSLNDSLQFDPRRSYWLSVQREAPDMQLIAISRSATPIGFNVHKGGRFAFDVLAIRQRGLQDAIRISANHLPIGVECPPIVLGPGVDRGTMVIYAEPSAEDQLVSLSLTGQAESAGMRPVRGSTVIRPGMPNGWSRLMSEIPLAVSGDAPARITAAIQDELDHHLYGHLKLRYSPGSVLDVAVALEHLDPNYRPSARLRGVGLPPLISQSAKTISAGERTGVLSFFLPSTLPPGTYSLAVSAETTIPAANGKSEAVTLVSNPVTFTVEPAAFKVAIDPFTPQRVKRGETFQVKYAAVRENGFIGKIHTELACPGIVTDVPGLRGRGVTFVGQTEAGEIQIVINDDAELGVQPFLRLFGVGVVEDQPTCYGSALLPLEITE